MDTVNDPTIISRNANLVSINGALSVDLYGQVMADNIDGRQISGVGGHEDFVAGAELHLDARSLICLRSTAVRDGEVVSRIAGVPPEGSVVSTPRHHTGVVITEYGVAELTGAPCASGRTCWPTSPTRTSAVTCAKRPTDWAGLTAHGSAGRAGLGVDGLGTRWLLQALPRSATDQLEPWACSTMTASKEAAPEPTVTSA